MSNLCPKEDTFQKSVSKSQGGGGVATPEITLTPQAGIATQRAVGRVVRAYKQTPRRSPDPKVLVVLINRTSSHEERLPRGHCRDNTEFLPRILP